MSIPIKEYIQKRKCYENNYYNKIQTLKSVKNKYVGDLIVLEDKNDKTLLEENFKFVNINKKENNKSIFKNLMKENSEENESKTIDEDNNYKENNKKNNFNNINIKINNKQINNNNNLEKDIDIFLNKKNELNKNIEINDNKIKYNNFNEEDDKKNYEEIIKELTEKN